MTKPAVEITNFSFSINGFSILKDISLTIEEGACAAFIGPNGAGKSTLLKCLNRIHLGGTGHIKLFGKNLAEYSQKDIGRLIGYVPQIREGIFPFNVYDFVCLGRYPYLNPLSRVSKEDKDIVERALNLIGIDHLRCRAVATLSGGERQKVFIAASLVQQPKILLLDEPTAHLDPKYQVDILKTIARVSKQFQMTVLQVTHDLNHIIGGSDQVVAMKDGKIHRTGSPAQCLTPPILQEIFNSKFYFLTDPKIQGPVILPEV